MIVILAEKPSVARDLATSVGAQAKHRGYFEGNGYRVTWAVGHLVGLAQPDEINPAWRGWSRETLPMLPEAFPLVVLESGKDQYRIVEQLLRDRTTTALIAATDAGREGELIFRYIYEKSGCTKPWKRLWLASMTPSAIAEAFERLAPGSQYDGLGAAARARSEADWIVGMNLSRACTITNGQLFTVGRVQTPTLAMIVSRDREIQQFVPTPYLEVEAVFASEQRGLYRGTFYEAPHEGLLDEHGHVRPFQALRARLPADGEQANAIAARAREGSAKIVHLDRTTRHTPAPQLFDLTTLQKEANRLYGLSAQATLDAAQELYENHKALSYPRTDSRYLSCAVAQTLPGIVQTIAPLYPGLVAANSGSMPSSKIVNDKKVTDHHALIPTLQRPHNLPPQSPAAQVYDLVCRRLLMVWHPELVEAVTRLITAVETPDTAVDLYATQGISVEVPGWTVLEPRTRSDKPSSAAVAKIPGGLAQDESLRVEDVVVHSKATRPPHGHTEATLLAAMEFAGRKVEDESLRESMREFGLGTPATRAPTIETLLKRGYIVRQGKTLTSTSAGRALIDAVHDQVKSPEMTGRWEQRLRAMEQGGDSQRAFIADIARYVSEVVAHEASKPAAPRQTSPARAYTNRSRRPRSRLRYNVPPTVKQRGA